MYTPLKNMSKKPRAVSAPCRSRLGYGRSSSSLLVARRAMDTPLKSGHAYAHGQHALPYGRGSVAVAVHVFHHLGWPARAMGTPCRSRLGNRALAWHAIALS